MMKYLITALTLATSLTLSAQDADLDEGGKKSPEDRAKHRTERMTKELALSPEQIAKVNTVNINFARAISEVKEMKDVEARRTRTVAAKEKRDGELRTILTPEQFTKWEAARDAKKKEHRDKKDKKPHQE